MFIALEIRKFISDKLSNLIIYLFRFRTEHQGLVDVKGKGMLDTYWLEGKEGGVGKWNENDYEYSLQTSCLI